MQTILFNLNTEKGKQEYINLTKNDKFQNQNIADRKIWEDHVELHREDKDGNEITLPYDSKLAVVKVEDFKVGQTINHYIFGEGTITNIDSTYITVDFGGIEKVFSEYSLLDAILYEIEEFDKEFYTMVQNTYSTEDRLKLYKKYNKNKTYEDDKEFWDWLEAKCF